MTLSARGMDYTDLNEVVRRIDGDCDITDCLGQRFIAAGASDRKIRIFGVPGNALGAYLNGAEIVVHGNAQDAVGDTMNEGKIIVHGNIGDAVGYAMRGGVIFVKGNAGYRAGIHMKAYKEKSPTLVIGGCAGSFLGEYQAGGTIIVLGLEANGKNIVSNFPCTGMHGGKMLLRSDCNGIRFPDRVNVAEATEEDIKAVEPRIREFCALFGYDAETLLNAKYTIITPDTKNPYKQMYVAN